MCVWGGGGVAKEGRGIQWVMGCLERNRSRRSGSPGVVSFTSFHCPLVLQASVAGVRLNGQRDEIKKELSENLPEQQKNRT